MLSLGGSTEWSRNRNSFRTVGKFTLSSLGNASRAAASGTSVPAVRDGNRLSGGAMPFSTHSNSATSAGRPQSGSAQVELALAVITLARLLMKARHLASKAQVRELSDLPE